MEVVPDRESSKSGLFRILLLHSLCDLLIMSCVLSLLGPDIDASGSCCCPFVLLLFPPSLSIQAFEISSASIFGRLSRTNCAHLSPSLPWPSKTPKNASVGRPAKLCCAANASWLGFCASGGIYYIGSGTQGGRAGGRAGERDGERRVKESGKQIIIIIKDRR